MDASIDEIRTHVLAEYTADPKPCDVTGCQGQVCFYLDDPDRTAYFCEKHFREVATEVNADTLRLQGAEFEEMVASFRFLNSAS